MVLPVFGNIKVLEEKFFLFFPFLRLLALLRALPSGFFFHVFSYFFF